MPLAPRCTTQTVCQARQPETILVQPVCFFPLLMPLLTEILSPDLPQHDLIAAHPDWTRADFNRAVFALSGSLKTAGIQSAALWFDYAYLFS